jgi:hypothetical protein
MEIVLPHSRWHERPYQRALWDFLRDGGKRAFAVWHRRAGKDDIGLHFSAIEMHKRVGNVWYCLPEYNQGRKAIWTAVNSHTGKRRIDEAFPEALRENTSDNEMFIRFRNGSTFQVVGSDQHSRTVGASPMGIVFSEWSLANPSAWAYYRPILEENNGWALFITTPRGRNHAYDMARYAQASPDWFYELLTVEDTGALTQEQLAETLKEYTAVFGADMGNALYRQELYCDFNAAVLGSFYAHEMVQVRAEGRITEIEPPPGALVSRSWDLGMSDDTSIWWFSVVGSQIFVYDHLAQSGAGLEWWRDEIERRHAEHGWAHGADFVPHDAEVKEMGTGRTRIETMRQLGLRPMRVPWHKLDDGINAVRRTLPLTVFHPRCEDGGISALEQYRREWDDEKKAFRASAVHDWSSHPCFTGDTLVLTRYGMRQIKDLPQSGEVLTPCGWKPYQNPRITRRNAPLVEVAFIDGLSVRCTPDHLFATENGWQSAASLTPNTPIRSSLTLSRSISVAGFIACGRAMSTIRAAARSSTAMLGSLLSALSPRGATFITEMATQRITPCPTSNAWTHSSIYQEPPSVTQGVSHNPLAMLQRRGMDQRLAGFGIAGTPRDQRVGPSGNANQKSVPNAGKPLVLWSARVAILKSIAALTARRPTIASVRELDYRDDVWCLTVPDAECFSLANGAVVHNCDSFRYLSMSWRAAPLREVKVPAPTGWRIPPPDDRPRQGIRL